MQTFLPYVDFDLTAQCLDTKRLGKQRVEALQIYRALRGLTKGWVNHPATKMWRGNEYALMLYHDAMIREWVRRGFRNTMKLFDVPDIGLRPTWITDERVMLSHQSALLRKDTYYYMKYGWQVPDNLPYFWPVN